MIEVDWKKFKDKKELPLNTLLIVKYENKIIEVSEFYKDDLTHEIYTRDDEDCIVDIDWLTIGITHWSTLEEKPKEKGSRVYLDFSEKELEELQELLKLAKTKIEIMISDSKEEINRLRNNLKKFQNKFSKVEF